MAEDVLSQQEVDSLLSAIDDDAIGSEEDLGSNSEQSELSVYDFKRPERVSKDQIRALENLHEVFARNLQAALSSYLRTVVEVKICSIEQLTYSEFIMSLPNPTCFNVMSCNPLEGRIILEINPAIIFPIIDYLLGGGGIETVSPDRELTDIELRLTGKITDLCINYLKEMWNPIQHIDLKVVETESNPQLLQIVPPNEVVVLICFEVKMGEVSGMMNLCMPFLVIEPIISEFSTRHWFSREQKADVEVEKNKLRQNLRTAKLETITYIAKTRLTVKEILRLKEGDVIETDKLVKSNLLMTVQGKPKFFVRPGKIRHKKAVRIIDHSPEGSEV